MHPLDQRIKLPSHVAYVRWGFPSPLVSIQWDLCIVLDPGEAVGEYLALFNGTIDGSQFYLGLQTDVSHPGAHRGIGKGLIFSTWWSFDASDSRIAEDGFVEKGTHEGKFIGVRRPYRWSTGNYRVTLIRSEAEAVAGSTRDWFDLYIEPIGEAQAESAGADAAHADPRGRATWIGGLRFPRLDAAVPARVEPGGLLFLEIYSGARTWAEVEPWRVTVSAAGDGEPCREITTEYTSFPFGQKMPNVNARYDADVHGVELAIGPEVIQRDPPGRWEWVSG